jgi:hypothetical protein
MFNRHNLLDTLIVHYLIRTFQEGSTICAGRNIHEGAVAVEMIKMYTGFNSSFESLALFLFFPNQIVKAASVQQLI